jgi:precorrin-8X/cobalt-precorrin-8 methylmutase
MEFTRPADIERESMAIIARELAARGVSVPAEHEAVVRRVIHTTADFDYAETLRFTPDAVRRGVEALRRGVLITDTNMALAGVSKPALKTLGASAYCYMAEEEIARQAKERGVTRAVVAVDCAVERFPRAVFAIGNAPTALLRLAEHIEGGARPALVIGVPVGFVNVVESKERMLAVCERYELPAILAMGRKGGSTVAAAICNALLYTAAGRG